MADPNPTCWVDTSVLTGSDGSAVSSLTDISGNGIVFNSAGGGTGPLLRVASQNGLNCLEFGSAQQIAAQGAAYALQSATSFMDSSYDTAATILIACEYIAPPGTSPTFTSFANFISNGNGGLIRSNYGNSTPLQTMTAETGGLSIPSFPSYPSPAAGNNGIFLQPESSFGIMSLAYDGSTLHLGWNGMIVGLAATGNLGWSGASLFLGAVNIGGFLGWVGRYMEYLQFDQCLTLAQLNRQLSRIRQKWLVKPRPVSVFIGTSYTSGYTTASPTVDNFCYQYQQIGNEKPDVLVLGQPGERITGGIATYGPTAVDWCINDCSLAASRPPQLYVDPVIYNEYRQNSQNMSAAESATASLFSSFRNGGWDGKAAKLIGMTPLPSTDAGSGITNYATAFLSPVTAWTKAQVPTLLDAAVDFSADPILGNNSIASVAAYFYSDGIHPTAYTDIHIGELIYLVDRSLVTAPSSLGVGEFSWTGGFGG